MYFKRTIKNLHHWTIATKQKLVSRKYRSQTFRTVMGDVYFDGEIDLLAIVAHATASFLIEGHSVAELQADHYRSVVRQLCSRSKAMVTRKSQQQCEMRYGSSVRRSIHPTLWYDTPLFHEKSNWWILRSSNFPPHLTPLRRHCGRDAVNGDVTKPARQLGDDVGENVKRCLIRKYALHSHRSQLHDLCETAHLDLHVIYDSFGRADRKRVTLYCYDIYSVRHRNNRTLTMLSWERSHHAAMQELLRQVKRCDFPTCTNWYSQPRRAHWPLCHRHTQKWKIAFERAVRPSTSELLGEASHV